MRWRDVLSKLVAPPSSHFMSTVRKLGSVVSADLEWSSLHFRCCRCIRRSVVAVCGSAKKEFSRRLYRIGHYGQTSCQGECDEGNYAPDDRGDGPHRPRAVAGAVVAGEEAQFAARCDEVRQADRQEYLLMREWLSACLEPSLFVSGAISRRRPQASFAQVLAVNPIVKTVEMFKEAGQR